MPKIKKASTASKPLDAENSKEKSKRKKGEWLKQYQFKPGVSGKPGGRPKKPLTEAYRSILEESFPNDPKQRTFARMIAEGQAKAAIKGKTDAAREIRECVEGKIKVEVSGPEGDPISHTIALDDEILELIKQLAGK